MAVSFDEETGLNSQVSMQRPESGGISGWLVRKGLAANQTSADLTLVLIIIISSALAIAYPLFITTKGGRDSEDPQVRAATRPLSNLPR